VGVNSFWKGEKEKRVFESKEKEEKLKGYTGEKRPRKKAANANQKGKGLQERKRPEKGKGGKKWSRKTETSPLNAMLNDLYEGIEEPIERVKRAKSSPQELSV